MFVVPFGDNLVTMAIIKGFVEKYAIYHFRRTNGEHFSLQRPECWGEEDHEAYFRKPLV